jgi:hypothetical protein
MSEQPNETYLGDAVYASFDGYQICLRTGDGNDQTIYIDPTVYEALRRFASQFYKPHRGWNRSGT